MDRLPVVLFRNSALRQILTRYLFLLTIGNGTKPVKVNF